MCSGLSVLTWKWNTLLPCLSHSCLDFPSLIPEVYPDKYTGQLKHHDQALVFCPSSTQPLFQPPNSWGSPRGPLGSIGCRGISEGFWETPLSSEAKAGGQLELLVLLSSAPVLAWVTLGVNSEIRVWASVVSLEEMFQETLVEKVGRETRAKKSIKDEFSSKSPSVGNWDLFPPGEQCRAFTLMWSPFRVKVTGFTHSSHQLLLECCSRRFWWPERSQWGMGWWKGAESWNLGKHPENGVCHRDKGWLPLLHRMCSLCLTTRWEGRSNSKEMWPQSLGIKVSEPK